MNKYNIDTNFSFKWSTSVEGILDLPNEIIEQDESWNLFLANNSPMGSLLKKSALFETVKHEEGLTVLHATNNLEDIIKSGKLLSSGGGLGACIYGTPLRDDSKCHNLTNYIIENELPMFLNNKKRKINIDTIAIKLNKTNFYDERSIMKVNYLNWGKEYLKVFRDQIEIGGLTNELNSLVDEYRKLTILTDLQKVDSLNMIDFENVLENLLNLSESLKVVFFETLLEYSFLFQNSDVALKYKSNGELYNDDIKNMIFKLNPLMTKRFTLKNFTTNLSSIFKYIENEGFVKDFSKSRFYNFMKWRISHNLRYQLSNCESLNTNVSSSSELYLMHPSFTGFGLYRMFKKHSSIESKVADLLWDKWRKNKVRIVHYSNIPKGEIGIIPSPYLDYKIYKTEIDDGMVKLTTRIKASLVNELASQNLTTMRSPYNPDLDN